MDIKFIVIDDQIELGESRKTQYSLFKEEFNKKSKAFLIDFDYLEDISSLSESLVTNDYMGAIVDVVLNEFWPTANLDKVIELLSGKGMPIALVSKKWNDLNSDQLTKAYSTQYVRTVLNWRDISGEQLGDSAYAINQLMQLICDNENIRKVSFDSSQSLYILHMSDLQFGGFKNERLRQEANLTADKVLEACDGNTPTFLAITGDVAELASLHEYDVASEWLGYFLPMITSSNDYPPHLLLVPGNHDVSIPLASSSRLSLKEKGKDEGGKKLYEVKLHDTIKDEDLVQYAFRPYQEFVRSVSDLQNIPGCDDELTWIESRYRHLGVVFYGLNTSVASSVGLPDRKVNEDHLAEISKSLKELLCRTGTPPLVVGMCHHNPISASGDRSVTNHGAFTAHFGGKIRTGLFLHGHVHQRTINYTSENDYRLVRSCAPTLNKGPGSRPSDTLRGFNVIELKRENNHIIGLRAEGYSWDDTQIQCVTEKEYEMNDDGMFKEK